MVDSAGAVVWQAAYMPFGEARILTADIENNLRFPGQYYDAESGLHYNWHRYYDPETGRYLRADPIGLVGGVNVYSYTQNNPINAIDPDGRLAWVIPAICAGGGCEALAGALAGIGSAIGFYAIGDWLWNENTEEDDHTECPKDEDFADDIAEHSKKHNPRIPTDELSELIKDTIGRGEKKDLERGRRAYRDPLTGRVVIVDPSSPDKGTSFIPNKPGYYDNLD